ncbi:MAG: hypothetical protein U0401_36210, partial [Anaerolineae bacterium]
MPARRHRPQLYPLITLLLTSLATLALYGLLSLFSVAYSQLVAVIIALLLFALGHPWLEMVLERHLHPEQLAYRQLMSAYGQLVQEAPHLSGMLPYVGRTLCADLAAPSA